MATPSLAYGAVTLTFDRLVPLAGINPYETVLENVTRPGIAGTAFRTDGPRAEPFQMASVLGVANAAGAQNAELAYATAVGNFATLTLDNTGTRTNVMIVAVRDIRIQAAVGGTGFIASSVTYTVSAAWTLQYTSQTASIPP